MRGLISYDRQMILCPFCPQGLCYSHEYLSHSVFLHNDGFIVADLIAAEAPNAFFSVYAGGTVGAGRCYSLDRAVLDAGIALCAVRLIDSGV